jgi:hypothetical protein
MNMQVEKVLVRGLLRMLLTVWSKMMSVWVLKVGQPGNLPSMAARFHAYAIISTMNSYKIKMLEWLESEHDTVWYDVNSSGFWKAAKWQSRLSSDSATLKWRCV